MCVIGVWFGAFLQILCLEVLGKATDFQAVPGCGLKCKVTNIEQILDLTLDDVDILNRRNSTSSFKVTIDKIGKEQEEFIPMDDIIGRSGVISHRSR